MCSDLIQKCKICKEELMIITDEEILGNNEYVWHVCPKELCGCDGHTNYYVKRKQL